MGTSPAFTQQGKITVSDAAADDQFGHAVSVSGDTALVGAPLDDDGGSASGSAYIFTVVGKALEPLAVSTVAMPDATAETPYDFALERSGGVPALAWSVAAGDFPFEGALDPFGGIVDGTAGEAGDYEFTLGVTDDLGSSAEAEFSLTVNPLPAIEEPSALEASADRPFTAGLARTGGTPPFTWSISEGTLPAGVAIDPDTGALSGTPTDAGPSVATAMVTDRWGAEATQVLDITVNSAPAVAEPEVILAAVGRSFQASLDGTGGTAPLSWSLSGGALPEGITMEASTGVLSGTPEDEGRFEAMVRVTDAWEAVSDSATVVIDVARVADLSAGKLDVVRDGRIHRTLELCGGTALTIKARFPSGSMDASALRLLDSEGAELDFSAALKTTPKSLVVSKFPVPATGRYFLELLPPDGFVGLVALSVKVAAPRKSQGAGSVSDGSPLFATVSTLPGALVTLKVKAAKGSTAIPTILSVKDADGNELLVAEELREAKTSATLKMGTPVPGGDLTVKFGVRDESSGQVLWTAKIKEPRGYEFELADQP